ncbi:sigma-70 family RNA polymerase sigma factor [Erythrobacter sp.]|uniref:RNA polymerase sigma factor n=1 Tax=Erythrobacter sp. TaxID=1042 RepID=UPI0025F05AC4|nr:sigma-70 family RNA polymerase sigma factor [Erythrobacter sp.]
MANDAQNSELLQILLAMAEGEKAAMHRLYVQTSREIYSLCFSFIQNREASEDVVHEVYLKAWNRATSYDQTKGSPMAWLTRIARNSAIDWIRAHKRRPTTGDDELIFVADQSETAEEMLIRVEQSDNVRQQVENLASADANLIRSAYLRGMTYSEVANETGLPLGTVKTRIRRGLRMMRERMIHD